MRSIAQMKTVILRSVDDPDGDEYNQTLFSEDGTDYTILDERMWDAARIFWGDLMADARGRAALYATYSDDVLSADIEEYDLPGDCSMLLGLDVKWTTSQERWTPLENREPPRYQVVSGSDMLYGETGYYDGDLYWYDDLEPGKVRIWPALNTVNDETIRFRYLCTPVWPSTEDDTFDDPDGDGDVEYPGLPSETDIAIEALTAAFLAEEELEDGTPVGYFGQKYNMLLARILRVTAGQIKPPRRYVRRPVRSIMRTQ